MRLVLFGCIRDCWAELLQKFVPRSRVGIFRNERTRSTPLDPKHMFWCVSYHLRAFGTVVRLPYETRGKTFQTSAKVRATKSHRSFSRRTQPIHPIGSHVLVGFIPFGCIWDRLAALRNSVQNGPNYCKSSCHEVASIFFDTNAPDPAYRTLK